MPSAILYDGIFAQVFSGCDHCDSGVFGKTTVYWVYRCCGAEPGGTWNAVTSTCQADPTSGRWLVLYLLAPQSCLFFRQTKAGSINLNIFLCYFIARRTLKIWNFFCIWIIVQNVICVKLFFVAGKNLEVPEILGSWNPHTFYRWRTLNVHV